MNRTSVACLAIALSAGTVCANATTVLLSSPDPALSGSMVQDDFKLIGFIGDFVELAPGDHHLSIAAPRDYSLFVDLHVSADAVTVGAYRTEPGNCKPMYNVNWEQPTLKTTASKKQKKKKSEGARPDAGMPSEPASAADTGHWTLLLAAPVFGPRLNTQACAQPSMMGCNQDMMVVDFKSNPPGAEIWIDNKRVGSTNTTLSVPYCPKWDKTKEVLMRLPGRRNCPIRLDVVTDGKRVPLNCELAAVP